MRRNVRRGCLGILLTLSVSLPAQGQEPERFVNWAAPPYWLPTDATTKGHGGVEPGVPAGREALAGRAPLAGAASALPFFPLPPCRLVDTRGNAPLTGGFLPAATVRSYTLAGVCGVPANAEAISLNATAVNPTGPGFLVLYPQGGTFPPVSTLNFLGGDVIVNAAVVPLSATGGISIALGVSGGDVILDTNGYYAAAPGVASLNAQAGNVTLAAGANTSVVVSSPGTLTISSAGSLTGVTAGTGLAVSGGAPSPTVLIPPAGIQADRIAAGQVVKSLNGQTDAVTLQGGANVTVASSAGVVTVSAAAVNPLRIALRRWHDGIKTGIAFTAGASPSDVAFDGQHVWVANLNGSSLTKLRASDGLLEGTFALGSAPYALAFDGAYVWTANFFGNSVTKVRASDGATFGPYAVGSGPRALAFDGAAVWVANTNANTVSKLRASDGFLLGSFATGTSPIAIAFDGIQLWVANSSGGSVTRLRASDGANLGTVAVGASPRAVCFDGTHVWVANFGGNSVTKLLAKDGSNLGTYATGAGPYGVEFDGTHVWVANFTDNTVTKLRASDGANLGTYSVGTNPKGLAFDGANIWVANTGGSTVSKL